MAKGKSSLHYRKHISLVAAKTLKITEDTAKGTGYTKDFRDSNRDVTEILRHLLGYFPDIREFNWKLDWTCDPDGRYGDGYHTVVSCSVRAQPEQLVV